ncbi:hypothetical protein [Amycolatopsis anabasis]|uniref:hypothetical protein n=1 Tax=Amycolatopsis anabasis TaxID=1840409 RepID=UPI00131C689B|nr:hypothetical protein [Amycolatopsis anabasis]
MNRNRIWAAIGSAGLLASVGAGLVVTAAPAQADKRCSYQRIAINNNPGAEPGSYANGHKHRTGNHYILRITDGNKYHYWADNNGGRDGDTWDTFYGYKRC